MLATTNDNAVVLFLVAALCFFALMIYDLAVAPRPRTSWNALLPLGLTLCAIAFAIIYHQSI